MLKPLTMNNTLDAVECVPHTYLGAAYTPANRFSGDGVGLVAQRIRTRGYEPRCLAIYATTTSSVLILTLSACMTNSRAWV